MSAPIPDNLGDLSMIELFRVEAEAHFAALNSGLVALDHHTASPAELEALMRAAHSLKGAARIVGLEPAVRVAHAMEDAFSSAQRGQLNFQRAHLDQLLAGVDLLTSLAQTPETGDRAAHPQAAAVDQWLALFLQVLSASHGAAVEPAAPPASRMPAATSIHAAEQSPDRFLRVTADHLNRLLGLSGEALIESRRLKPFLDSLQRLKRLQSEALRQMEAMPGGSRFALEGGPMESSLVTARSRLVECQRLLADRLTELETIDRRASTLSTHLHHEALACRMRPFADGLHGLDRMVRDVSRALGREVRLEVVGESTQVDRDVLQQLEAPLTHLLRNAVDHGIESPATRLQAGKTNPATLRIHARHSAGLLLITVSDDGVGIDLARLRQAVVRHGHTSPETASRLSEPELLEFLFLPGFTMRESVTEFSGRGVGLDVVQTMVRGVRGNVRVHTEPGRGTRFELQLPLTLSVMRTLLAEIDGEPYAFPLAQLQCTLKLARDAVRELEGRQHFEHGGRLIGLVTAHQILDRPAQSWTSASRPVIVLGSGETCYGVLVDRVLGERELVVQPLDRRLGKVRNISAGGLLEDGSPVLIVDVDDFLRSLEKALGEGDLNPAIPRSHAEVRPTKRILVVDDSLTVRELQRQLLTARGYEVELAVDGIDGWNAARSGRFHLVISDVDMPRMDGIELVTQLKRDPRLKSVPVMIVSYKDRDEDRRRGLEAGADYYLTKGSFHDHRLIEAVVDLIGEAA